MRTKGHSDLHVFTGTSFEQEVYKRAGQTQCRRLPHEWGLGKGKTEASSFTGTSLEQEVYGQFISTSGDDGPNQYFKKFGSW